MSTCPCSSQREYDVCCAPIIAGDPAPTAEALVRSRYTAFVVRVLDHIEQTHAPEIKSDFNRAEAERLAEECTWRGLHIHSAKESGNTAEVGFVIEFQKDQKVLTKAALSSFRRENGHWLFVSSKPAQHLVRRNKIGRNAPCTCQSGKKYKKCCGSSAESLTS